MLQGGYWGRILFVDLTTQSTWVEELSEETAYNYVGGAGLGIKYLYDLVPPGIDPLDSENRLIFTVGPFTGTSIPCSSRMAVTAKSPLTGTVGVALTGGHFPNEFKKAGYDGLVIEGKSDRPVYLEINEEEVIFHNAEHLLGLETTPAQETIKRDLGDEKMRIICIGPAGENLSKLACLINELRAAGRKGLGAVMGSKNLKAVAVRGKKKVPIADKEKFDKARKDMLKVMKESNLLYPIQGMIGTPVGVDACIGKGIFAARNWSATGEFNPVKEIGVEGQISRKIGREHCFGCPVGCSQLKKVKSGKYAGMIAEGPEFETLYSFGGQTGVDNLDSIIAADRISDELGMDTMSAGVVIGFAMELYEKGILTIEDTHGMELEFGNHEAMVDLLYLMANREGIGDLLTDGVADMARKIGRDTQDYAMHVKGLELPAYDVRGAKAQGLNYATAYCGADHNKGYAFQEIMDVPVPEKVDRLSIEGKGKLTKWNQDSQTVLADCTIQCSFILAMATLGTAMGNCVDIMEGLTGFVYTEDEFLQVGERINNLARVFNCREGFTRKDDTLPKRLMKEAISAGNSKGAVLSEEELNIMLDEYYSARGWVLESGTPTAAKLTELGLGSLAQDIKTAQ